MRVEGSEVLRRLEQFKGAIRAAGVRITPQRLEIFRQVAASADHPDAEAVYRAVRKRMPTVSLDTVYRTLWLLNDLGLVTDLGPRRESVRFDANLEPHHHYVCLRCGLVRDFGSAELDSLRIPEQVRGLGEVLATNVEVRGVCRDCVEKRTGVTTVKRVNAPQGQERRSTWRGRSD